MKTYSMNDYVYFKLTETGHAELNRQAEKFHREFPKCDIQYKPNPYFKDWYRKQFHDLVETFGERSSVGMLLPFDSITFDDPKEKDGGKSC